MEDDLRAQEEFYRSGEKPAASVVRANTPDKDSSNSIPENAIFSIYGSIAIKLNPCCANAATKLTISNSPYINVNISPIIIIVINKYLINCVFAHLPLCGRRSQILISRLNQHSATM